MIKYFNYKLVPKIVLFFTSVSGLVFLFEALPENISIFIVICLLLLKVWDYCNAFVEKIF